MSSLITLVVPCYNEAPTIADTLSRLTTYLHAQTYAFEIIVVNDGSTDETVSALRALSLPHLFTLDLPHRGKGAAVRAGMLRAKGSYRIFLDADLAVPPETVGYALAEVQRGHDIVIASRFVVGSRLVHSQGFIRRTLGYIFRRTVRFVMRLPFSDTQTGFKLFTQDAAERVFPALITEGWCFDVELLHYARSQGLSISEIPVAYSARNESRMTLRGICEMAIELAKIRARTYRMSSVPARISTDTEQRQRI